MIRLLCSSGKRESDDSSADGNTHHTVSSFQAFAVSIASRVGTGNLAGVATAIAIGGAGSIFNSVAWFGLGFCRVDIGAIV